MRGVVHISRSDSIGGSARSAYKIHAGLRERGVESRMLVARKETVDADVDRIDARKRGLQIGDAVGRQVVDRFGFQYLFYPSTLALDRHPWLRSADVIQLYNTHGGFFSHKALPRLSRGRRIVWRLSDMWPLTGHCAYSLDCERWRTGCGSCPQLAAYPALPFDRTARLWKIKERVYRRADLTIVATNSWMEGIVRESPLLCSFPVHRIPNGVDVDIFRPIDRTVAREALGLDPSARILLFLGHVAQPGTRKGGEKAVEAIERLVSAGRRDIVLLVAGEGSSAWPDAPCPVVRFGYTDNDRFLAILYAAADLLLAPALAENFPNTILEAMACGTPTVAFPTGGIPDVVRDGWTGCLTRTSDGAGLASSVEDLLEDPSRRSEMARRGREVVLAEYTLQVQAAAFENLYRSLVDDR